MLSRPVTCKRCGKVSYYKDDVHTCTPDNYNRLLEFVKDMAEYKLPIHDYAHISDYFLGMLKRAKELIKKIDDL